MLPINLNNNLNNQHVNNNANAMEISHLNYGENNNNMSPNVLGRIDINLNQMYNHPQTISVELRNAPVTVSNNYMEVNNNNNSNQGN